MSIPSRIANGISSHSKIVLVTLLVTTVLIGSGATMVDDDSSLEQFESDSPEAQAAERISENFSVEDQENTTTVQVIVSGDNVLSQESLLRSLEFQQELRNDERINATLAGPDAITGVENILVITAMLADQETAHELDGETADDTELDADENFDAANETADDTRQDTEELDPDGEPNGGDEVEADNETAGAGEQDVGEQAFETPPLDEQIAYLEAMDDEEFEAALTSVLGEDADDSALGLMQSSYEPGSTQADARMFVVTQDLGGDDGGDIEGIDRSVIESQLDLRDLANEQDDDYLVFGFAVMMEEIDQSMGDSLAIVGPLALLFVVVALAVAYRDLLDIVLGVLGIVAVLFWTFGFMGWTGISFNQMMIAVPVLLIGLSIDYAIHVFMRHREQRESLRVSDERAENGANHEQRETNDGPSTVRGSMAIALAGVGVALVWVTATTMIGFLANVTSPIGPIQEFGVVSAFGILAALVVFGGLVPAAKVEIDGFLESRGIDRRKRAFGTGGGRASKLLSAGTVAARKAPVIVIICALVFTAGGVYGATQVDTSFDDEDFLAESPPEWTNHLGPFAPGEYQAKDDLEFVNENFQREDANADILIEGDVTDDDVLNRIDEAENAAADGDVAYVLPNGDADVQSPLSMMREAAANDEAFAEAFTAADTNDDGIPNENVSALYDQLFEIDEGAGSVIHRTEGGEYESLRLIVSIQGDAGFDETTDELREIAAGIESASGSSMTAIATGSPVVNHIVEQDLLDTVLESLTITLIAVFAFLTVAYWLTGNSATLGAVTLIPVLFSVTWILGTMHLIGMPFNVLTGMITSLTVGLGVAYSIHISSRYTLELERQGNVWDALTTTVTGTGGALLGSAATTVGGFGVLAFAILPVLQQFGIITGLTIIYAFLGSVVVLPSLLVLWTRYFGPDVSFDAFPSSTPTTASDGGHPETDERPADAESTDEPTNDG